MKHLLYGVVHGMVVIGPHFFQNEKGRAITTNGDNFRAMLFEFFWPELETLLLKRGDSNRMTLCGTVKVMLNLLKNSMVTG